jgi:pimeloyl-ACP methyl ester carboxylesterase
MSETCVEQSSMLTTADGISLSVTTFGVGAEPLHAIYVHGILADAQFWRPLVAHLQPQLAYQVRHVIYDARGHGRSTRPAKRSLTTFPVLADDLATVVDSMRGPVLLVAHSIGTCVVQEYARRHITQFREVVTGVIWFGGFGRMPAYPLFERHIVPATRWLRPLRTGPLDWVNAHGHALLERKFRRLTSKANPDRVQLVASSQPCDPRVLGDMVTALLRHRLDPVTALVLSDIPLHLVTAEFDRVTPPTLSEELSAQIPSARLTTVPTGGHSLPFSRPELAGTAVESAVAELAVRQRAGQTRGRPC